MKNLVLGIWMLFTAQAFLSYVDAREYIDLLASRGMEDHCAGGYGVKLDVNWNRLIVDYRLQCVQKTI